MKSWSNIYMKKSNAVVEAGRSFVGPTSSVKGCLAPNMITVGVFLLDSLYGSCVQVTCVLEVVLVVYSILSMVAELSGSPRL